MIEELKSVQGIWRKLPTEEDARAFLEDMVWPTGRHCCHCGGVRSGPVRGRSARPGLYQCLERECRRQFTVTTRTPMDATELDLRIWIAAIFLILTSSKGISSVVRARTLGVNQKTAWKLGHAVRELMDDRDGVVGRLRGVVEVDEAFIGGTPKPIALIAASRDGQARATLVADAKGATLAPIMTAWIDAGAILMTDGNAAYNRIGRTFAAHGRVNHGARQHADVRTGAHINTAEAVAAQIERALVGVWHRLSRKHLQRYLNEILWRWNHRERTTLRRRATGGTAGRPARTTTVWKPLPVLEQMRGLLCCAVGRELRRTPQWGLRWP